MSDAAYLTHRQTASLFEVWLEVTSAEEIKRVLLTISETHADDEVARMADPVSHFLGWPRAFEATLTLEQALLVLRTAVSSQGLLSGSEPA